MQDKYNFNDMKTILKSSQTKPEDWDKNNQIILKDPIKPLLFQAYHELERKIYLGERERVKKQPEPDDEEGVINNQEEWFMQYEGEITGPFYLNELIFRSSDLPQEKVKCKRNTDSIFIDLEIIKKIADMPKELELVFQKETEKQRKEKINPSVAIKSKKFIAHKNCSLQLNEILRKIKGKSKEKALKILNSYSGLSASENKKLISLLNNELANIFSD